MTPQFVAVDGEADQEGRYIVLCDSLGRALHNPDGIGTSQALPWLAELAGKVVVCYGLNYDANQWLRDFDPVALDRLIVEGGASYGQGRYWLRWLAGKVLSVVDNKRQPGNRQVRICEVFGFFQTSFVRALEMWGLEVPGELELMKRRRGTFTAAELDRVTAYCQGECRLLVALMDRLAAACAAAKVVPARNNWIGAGALASRLLVSGDVKDEHVYDDELTDEQGVEAIRTAYYGGRVELIRQGEIGPAVAYDVVSAYPHAATMLPSLQGMVLRRRRRFDPGLFGVWEVSWTGQVRNQLAPFPVRRSGGAILYPAAGRGVYHTAEIVAALRVGYQLEIQGGWVLVPRRRNNNGHAGRPFAFLRTTFNRRAALKRAGDPAERALKLALNSVYGKLAQGYSLNGEPPPFQSYLWAGAITAQTRARIAWLAHRTRGLVMISTDGIFAAAGPTGVGAGHARLGGWERTDLHDLQAWQPGVYAQRCPVCHDRGEITTDCARCRGIGMLVKSRGFFARDVDWQALRAVWREEGPRGVYHYDSVRFIGARAALARGDLESWRQWPTERRSITLESDRRLVAARRDGIVTLTPPPGPLVAVPYRPKRDPYDDPTDQEAEAMIETDQPHHDNLVLFT